MSPPDQPPKKFPGPVPRPSGEQPRISGVAPRGGAEIATPTIDHGHDLDDDLQEVDVDLTVEQQSRIAEYVGRLRTDDLYAFLGVERGADKKTIKRAYNGRAVEFHPDRFFRKRLGSFGASLHAIFVRMTEAHDILCSPEHRARYDEALRTNRRSLIDAMIEESAAEMAGETKASAREEIIIGERIVVPESQPPAPFPPPSKKPR